MRREVSTSWAEERNGELRRLAMANVQLVDRDPGTGRVKDGWHRHTLGRLCGPYRPGSRQGRQRHGALLLMIISVVLVTAVHRPRLPDPAGETIDSEGLDSNVAPALSPTISA